MLWYHELTFGYRRPMPMYWRKVRGYPRAYALASGLTECVPLQMMSGCTSRCRGTVAYAVGVLGLLPRPVDLSIIRPCSSAGWLGHPEEMRRLTTRLFEWPTAGDLATCGLIALDRSL